MRRMRVWQVGLALLLAALLAGCNPDDWQGLGQISEEFRFSHELKAGGELEVHTRNGSVEVLGWEKDTVEITGSKYARSQEDLNRIEVSVNPVGEGLVVKAVFPTPTRSGGGAKFVIRAPHSARVRLVDTSNGSIRVEDLERVDKLDTSNASITVNRCRGPLVADTSNGSIRVSQTPGDLTLDTSNARIEADDVEGAIVADTSNGSIKVTVRDPEPGREMRLKSSNSSVEVTMERFRQNPMRMESSNGSMTLRLPDGTDADLHASTSNGSIQMDYPMTLEGTQKKTEVRGKLGAGGPLVRIATSNSSIRILRN